MANTQKLGTIWKGRAWDDGEPIPRVTLPDGTMAEAMASLGYGWDTASSAFVKLTVKPGSVAPLATDPALVVTLSPNSPSPGTQAVTVGNFPATQPVSATSLPLPAGAALELGGQLQQITELLQQILIETRIHSLVLGDGLNVQVHPENLRNDPAYLN